MILDQLRRAVADVPDESLFECFRCGTTVRAGTSRCPSCESTDIVEYDLS